jgi:hypothetical protein
MGCILAERVRGRLPLFHLQFVFGIETALWNVAIARGHPANAGRMTDCRSGGQLKQTPAARPQSLAMRSETHPKGDLLCAEDSVGETPTGATERLEQQQAGPHVCGLVALP